MSEYIRDDAEVLKTVVEKANGIRRDGYKPRIQPDSSSLIRGILARVPTEPKYLRIAHGSGLPVVDPSSMCLADSLVESVTPQIKSSAMNRELVSCIKGGSIVRVPCWVAKGFGGGAPYQKSYMYVQADASMPEWWPRRLNETGSIDDLNYANYQYRTLSDEPAKETLTQKILSMLPDSPSTDIYVDSNTPGTVAWILMQLGIAKTRDSMRRITALLKNAKRNGHQLNVIHKKSYAAGRGVNLYYK